MKKNIILIFVLFLLAGCNNKERIYILTWHETFNNELIKQFETKHNVKVIIEQVPSNEDLYKEIKDGSNHYDITVPSDYMIEKMINENLLSNIDYTLIDNQIDYLKDLIEYTVYDKNQEYSIPYGFGTTGIMYNKSLEATVVNNGWNVLYEEFEDINKVGMYDSDRIILSSVLLYLNLDPNTTLESDLSLVEAVLNNVDYELFSDIDLTSKLTSNEFDVALVFSNEYFRQNNLTNEEDKFGYYLPSNTNLWIDNLVIPKNSKNKDLAHEFIDFMIDTDNHFKNLSTGYYPVSNKVYNKLNNDNTFNNLVNHSYYYPLNNDSTYYLTYDLDDRIYDIVKNVKH